MTEADLRARASSHLAHLDIETSSDPTREHHVAQAQVYLAELDRREDARIGARDYKLELWVIGLIGAELLLAVVGVVFGWYEGNQQAKVLSELNKSSAETAATLAALRKAQEDSLTTQKTTLENITAMNNALRDELDLNFADVLQYSSGTSSDKGTETMTFANLGRASFSVWKVMLGDKPAKLKQVPTVITPDHAVSVPVLELFQQLKKTQHGMVEPYTTITLFLTRDDGTKYVTTGVVKYGLGNYLSIDGKLTTKRKQW